MLSDLGCHDCRWGEGNCSRGFPVNTMHWIAERDSARWGEMCKAECRAGEQKRGRKARGQSPDWLPVILFPPAACLWRLQHCRRPWQTWAYCHWHRWPGCWQLLGCSAGRHPTPPSVKTRKRNGRCSFRDDKKQTFGEIIMLSGLFCFDKTCQTSTCFYHHNEVTCTLPLYMLIFHSLDIRKVFTEMRYFASSLPKGQLLSKLHVYLSLAFLMSRIWQELNKVLGRQDLYLCGSSKNYTFLWGELLFPWNLHSALKWKWLILLVIIYIHCTSRGSL